MTFTPRGIIVPVITPFTSEGRINEPVLRKVIDFLIDNGVHGIFPMGSCGEFYGVDEDDYRRVLEIAVDQANGRVPVYAGANHITTRGTVKLIRIAEKAGVDAITVLTPMFTALSQEELYMFFKTVAESTNLPVIMYNNKPKTNLTIEPETVARLAAIANIVGIKDSTGDFTNTAEYIRLTRHLGNFSVLIGRDTLIHAALCYGATGAIASCANVAPRLTADIYDRYMAGDMAGSLEAQYRLAPLRIAFNLGSFPEVVKAALEMQGFEVGKSLDPIAELPPDKKEKLRSLLVSMEILK